MLIKPNFPIQGYYNKKLSYCGLFSGSDSFNTTISGGSNKAYTFSTWIKPVNLYVDARELLMCGSDLSNADKLYLDMDNKIQMYATVSGTEEWRIKSTNKLDDTTSWYHIVLSVNTSLETEADRIKLYINGAEESLDSASTYPGEDVGYNVNADNTTMYVGNVFEGYIGETYFIDSHMYDASYFGKIKGDYWIPRHYSHGYGVTGWRNNFNNVTKDLGPNHKTFTATSLPTKKYTGPTYNISNINSEDNVNDVTISGCEHLVNLTSTNKVVGSTLAPLTSGKFYWEVLIDYDFTPAKVSVGIGDNLKDKGNQVGYDSTSYGIRVDGSTIEVGNNNTWTTVSGSSADTSIRVAYDVDNGNLFLGVDREFDETTPTFSGIVDLRETIPFIEVEYGKVFSMYDSKEWNYPAPTGYSAIENRYFPSVTKEKVKIFDYTGTGMDKEVETNFTPGLCIIKSLGTGNWMVLDTVRGDDKVLYTNSTHVEVTKADSVSFHSNGITIGTNGVVNNLGTNYTCILMEASPEAGLDIIKYTGDGSVERAINHDLGKKPTMIWTKRLTATKAWIVYVNNPWYQNTYYTKLSSALTITSNSTVFRKEPDEDSYYVGNNAVVNLSGGTQIAYVFTNTDWFQEGYHLGNDSTDGPYLYGITPVASMTKRIDYDASWIYHRLDNDAYMLWNSDAGEVADKRFDYRSNGLKVVGTSSNKAGKHYVYCMFGRREIKYGLGR